MHLAKGSRAAFRRQSLDDLLNPRWRASTRSSNAEENCEGIAD